MRLLQRMLKLAEPLHLGGLQLDSHKHPVRSMPVKVPERRVVQLLLVFFGLAWLILASFGTWQLLELRHEKYQYDLIITTGYRWAHKQTTHSIAAVAYDHWLQDRNASQLCSWAQQAHPSTCLHRAPQGLAPNPASYGCTT